MIYSFTDYLYAPENEVVEGLFRHLDWPDIVAATVERDAIDLVEKCRKAKGRGGQLEAFLQEFSLNTDEGLAMMCLAEALLRIPDAETANALIRDKVVAANWLQKQGGGSKDWMAKAAGFGMAMTRKTLDSSLSRLGEPVIREAMIRAMQMMGRQFVLGTDIADALSHARQWERQGYRMSYDMLGEGARDASTAAHYFEMYASAIDAISAKNGQTTGLGAGISVKLSALHPRYEYAQRERCIPELVERLEALAVRAASHDMPMTMDAEEAGRLDLSIDIFERVLKSDKLKGWDGFGLAVQAYQKRALPLIDYITDQARACGRRVQIRLVKGAYWDSEIKHAQMQGYPEYSVFTRKENTDLSYLACAQAMLAADDAVYPMFATHNAHTIAAVRKMAKGKKFEFQRLHGMGEALYAQVIGEADTNCSVYAPVGPHRDLLPYLVRRLLENGANSSFVNQMLDPSLDAAAIVRDPVAHVRSHSDHRHPMIALPQDIFTPERKNSAGLDLDAPKYSRQLIDYVENYCESMEAYSLVEGRRFDVIDTRFIERSFKSARAEFKRWAVRDVCERADIIDRFSDLLEESRDRLVATLVHEAGKTIQDAIDELREAVDFCRYYAARARKDFQADGLLMSGYTGEENRLTLEGRGVFVCISPWNFPLAIFTGQIVAALAAGNCVIAKPASQTRVTATRTVDLMLKAGVPPKAIQLLLGDGAYGGQIVAHKDVAGVAFTGSTHTAKHIQKVLAEENSAIVPFIAETGGQNAMIVDSSALAEQVVDDVLLSAFGSAGQRCSALRVLCLQEDIADNVIALLSGAMNEVRVGDPRFLSADIGPIIDESAKKSLDQYVAYLETRAHLINRCRIDQSVAENDRYFAPVAYEIERIDLLEAEVFGPVLHVIRFKNNLRDQLVEQINALGFGLTFGLHSRISSVQHSVARQVRAGNIYVNRSMIGAVVGVQPFGGMGISGTGPKAGGPNYLHVFAIEKLVCTDTTASGGNASLVSLT